MIHIGDIMNERYLADALAEGLVRVQTHPTLPLSIYNYTEKAQYSRTWNTVTTQCRGLIVGQDTGQIIARPFDKFFNADEHGPSKLGQALGGVVQVTNKMDGSLGILYPSPLHRTGYAIATRGSFTSEQALHATQLLNDRYADWVPNPDWTYLFEIVYPENRIVLDYGDQDDLVLLGARSIEYGDIVGPEVAGVGCWPGPRTEILPVRSFKEARTLPPRANAEGVVVRSVKSGFMVKLKQEDYVLLHRIITGMNERAVWERLGAGETIDGVCEGLPDEFWPWVRKIGFDLYAAHDAISISARIEFALIKSELGEDFTRKDFAVRAQQSDFRALLFLLLDGRDIFKPIWDSIKPAGGRSMVATGEDVA